MAIASIRILCELEFPSQTIRLWDGAGPYLDAQGEVWSGVTLTEGLDTIESAMNAEAATLQLKLSGVEQRIADLAYEELEGGDVIGAIVRLSIQDCDELDQPVGDPEVRFTGSIGNMIIDDTVSDQGPVSTIVAEVVNRFTLRTMTSGSVLSDTDQKARSAVLNPGANADRFAERVSGMSDRNVWWPRFT